ncbi:MAG: hypothetical protein WC243_04495 [Patescibacteria group bacterium]
MDIIPEILGISLLQVSVVRAIFVIPRHVWPVSLATCTRGSQVAYQTRIVVVLTGYVT